jgi:hypothetical protein
MYYMEFYRMPKKTIRLFLNLLFLSLLTNHLSASDVLLIGDSMAEAVALPLEKRFSAVSVQYRYMYKRGTKVNYWINNPEVQNSIKLQIPNYVLITLGTNDLVAQKTNTQIISDLSLLIDELVSTGVPINGIFLIATPIPNDNGLNEAMLTYFGDHVITSKNLQLALKPDNIHPLPESNIIWSDYIYNYLINFYKQ